MTNYKKLVIVFFSVTSVVIFLRFSKTTSPIHSDALSHTKVKTAQKFSNFNGNWDELNKKLDEKLQKATDKKVSDYFSKACWVSKSSVTVKLFLSTSSATRSTHQKLIDH